jgi:hypothetical protein
VLAASDGTGVVFRGTNGAQRGAEVAQIGAEANLRLG